MYFILNRKTSIHTYFLDLSTESLETMTNLIIMSTHNAQSVASKYQVSVNKPILLKRWLNPSLRQEKYKINWNNVPKEKQGIYKKTKLMPCPVWLSWLSIVLCIERFDSWLGHTPKLWVQFLARVCMGGNELMFLFHIYVSLLFLPFSIFKIN